jgi:hypothetical protein
VSQDTEHSSLVGGSTADRRINCPASYQLEQKVPKGIKEKSSIYADEGTALHECMAYILRNDIILKELDDKILGMEFAGFIMTREMVDEAIVPCIEFINELMDTHADEGEMQFMVECRVEIPGIAGAFGTADVIARTNERSIGIDWKFGAGVPVSAWYYEDVTGDDGVTVQFCRPNAQLCYYNRGGMHTFPHMYEDDPNWTVDMYIVQPRVYDGEKVSQIEVTLHYLERFRLDLAAAIDNAKSDAPRMERGPWCKFAACKTICPKWTGPALDLTRLGPKAIAKVPFQASIGKTDVDWPAMYAELLALADLAEPLIAEIRAQAHTYIGDGNTIPGWKIVDKRATERYRDETGDEAAAAARALGVDAKDTWTTVEVKSPAKLRDLMATKCQGKTQKDRKEAAAAIIGQFTVKTSSGTTLAHDGDSRPSIIPTSGQIVKLADKLKALTAPQK